MDSKKFRFFSFILALLAFAIPIEHKYDKPFRFFSLTLIPEGLQLPSSFDPKIYFYASDIAAFILFSIALIGLRVPLRRLFLENGSLFLWVLCGCAFLSILFSPCANYPLLYMRLLHFFTPVFLFCFLTQVFSQEQKQKITSLMLSALIAAAFFQSLIAITQYFQEGSLGLRILGEQKFGHHIGGSPSFYQPGGERWLLDSLFQRVSPYTSVIRPFGTMPHPNALGGFLMLSAIACYPFFVRSPKERWISGLAFPFIIFTLCLTYSRAALFAWILGTCLWFFLQIYQRSWITCWSDRSFRALCLLVVASASLSFVLLKDQYVHRGGVINYNQTARSSDGTRLYYQDIATRMIRSNPFFGVGYQQISLYTKHYLPPGEEVPKDLTATHNIYLYLAAETGLIALAAFLLFLFQLIRSALRSPFTPFLSALFAMFIAFLFIGGCDFYPLLFQQGKLLFFIVAALLTLQVREERKTASIHPLPSS